MHRIRNKRDFWAGAVFIVVGTVFAASSRQYDFGTTSQMGPGWFPTVIGLILTGLGAITIFGSLGRDESVMEVERIGWREIGLILAAVALFAASLSYLGVVLAASMLIFVSALASHEFRLRETLASTVVLLVLAYLLFVRGLSLQFPVWPAFLGG